MLGNPETSSCQGSAQRLRPSAIGVAVAQPNRFRAWNHLSSAAASFFRKQLLAFFLDDNRFSRREAGGKKDFFIAVTLAINNFSDHFAIELKNFRCRLNASSVPFALGSIHDDFHKTSARAFQKLIRLSR